LRRRERLTRIIVALTRIVVMLWSCNLFNLCRYSILILRNTPRTPLLTRVTAGLFFRVSLKHPMHGMRMLSVCLVAETCFWPESVDTLAASTGRPGDYMGRCTLRRYSHTLPLCIIIRCSPWPRSLLSLSMMNIARSFIPSTNTSMSRGTLHSFIPFTGAVLVFQ
jgi:hypothetical protein